MLTTAEELGQFCQSDVILRLCFRAELGKARRVGAPIKNGILPTNNRAPLYGHRLANPVHLVGNCGSTKASSFVGASAQPFVLQLLRSNGCGSPGTNTRCRDASEWSEIRLLARLIDGTSELYFTATCERAPFTLCSHRFAQTVVTFHHDKEAGYRLGSRLLSAHCG